MESDLFNLAKNLANKEKEKNEAREIINNAKDIAIDAIKSFCEFLNIDSNIFKDIYDIDIKIEHLYGNDEAQYFPNGNFIAVDTDYLNKNINMIKKNSALRYKILLNIELVLIHEMIHAKRRETILSNENDKNVGIEEIITDSISDLIVRSKINNNIDIDGFESRIVNGSEYDKSNILGASLIGAMKEEFVKWFLTSQQYDFIQEKFGDNYNDLVNYAFNIYIAEYNNKAVDDNDFINANKIIKH